MQGPTQPFNPWPDLVSDGGIEEVRGVPHVSLLLTVSQEAMGLIRGMVPSPTWWSVRDECLLFILSELLEAPADNAVTA